MVELAGDGKLIIMGGAVSPDTADIWQTIVADSGGPGAAIAVIAAAAGDPKASAQRTMDALTAHGAKPFFVPAAPRLAGTDYRAASRDPALAKQVDSSSAQTIGAALPEPGKGSAGFEFTFRKGPQTKAWLRIDKGRAHYTVSQLELDVQPMKVAQPLYKPR
jgi:hypothetical protein